VRLLRRGSGRIDFTPLISHSTVPIVIPFSQSPLAPATLFSSCRSSFNIMVLREIWPLLLFRVSSRFSFYSENQRHLLFSSIIVRRLLSTDLTGCCKVCCLLTFLFKADGGKNVVKCHCTVPCGNCSKDSTPLAPVALLKPQGHFQFKKANRGMPVFFAPNNSEFFLFYCENL